MNALKRIRTVRKRLGPYGRPHRKWLVTGTLGTIMVVACRLAFPWPLRGVLQLAFNPNGAVPALVPSGGDPELWLGGAFIVIVLCQGLAELVQRVSFARFSIGLVHDARAAAIEILSDPRQSAATDRDPGDLITRVIGDSSRVKSGLKGVLIRMTQNGIFFFGVLIVLTVIDRRLGLVFLAGGAVMAAIAITGAARVTAISRRARRREGRLASQMHEMLTGDRNGEDSEDVDTVDVKGGQAEAKTTKVEGLTTWGVHATLAVTSCAIVLLGLRLVRSGALQPADMFTVLFYLLMVHNPSVRLSRQTVRLGRVLASAERLAKVLKRRDDRPELDPVELATTKRLEEVLERRDQRSEHVPLAGVSPGPQYRSS
jgi:ABC-type multidrug transport system fused ATPase/permease subunit